ncbi:MAG: PqqD family protein [Thermodesulfobacteriota bacterium]
MFRKTQPPPITHRQALECRPIRNAEVVTSHLESGAALLTYPVRPKPWLAALVRLGARLSRDRSGGGNRSGKLELDGLGTAVWDMVDGRRSVREIVEQFTRQQRLHPREAEIAVTRFLRELGRRGIIGLG